MKKTALFQITLLALIVVFFNTQLYAQNDSPCECAQRWTGGGHWRNDGTVNDSSGAPLPHGVIRCGTAADNQTNIRPNTCVYNSSQFTIDLTGKTCHNPNTGLPVNINTPVNGCPIIWFNFDVRGLSGRYDYQIVTNSTVGWALYYSNDHQNGVDANGLSGDCSSLAYWACGSGFNNTFASFSVPVFSKATNLYLAVWDLNCSNPATYTSDLRISFKARDGCGNNDYCILETLQPTASCNADGSVTLAIPINGINSNYQGYDPNASPTTSNIVTLTNVALGGPTSGTIVMTYPHGVSTYNVLIHDVVAPSGDIVPLNPDSCTTNVTGSLPFCCRNLQTTRNVSICQGECNNAGGACQTAEGTYYDVSKDAEGCDSTVTTIITIQNCDDGNLCITDNCQNGVCSHSPLICDDHNPCTNDDCGANGCFTTPVNCADVSACTKDECLDGACSNSPIICDDKDDCTDDRCEDGTCTTSPVDCNDDNPCTDDGCSLGECVNTLACDDNNDCTIDVCGANGCEHSDVLCLDDGNPCTNEVCIGGGCETIPHCCQSPSECDDLNLCTTNDCVNAQCEYKPVFCDDESACTTDECISGECATTPLECKDSDACTDDLCDPLSGCVHPAHNCNDRNACSDDFCDPLTECYHNAISCDDNNACKDDLCNPGTGCIHRDVSCDDEDNCTEDNCEADKGCVHSPVNCNDRDACTIDGCDAIEGCLHDPVECNDFDACTDDLCEPEEGCYGVVHSCDDASECTEDYCEPESGCYYANVNCSDNDKCTDDFCAPATGCFYQDVNCDDHDLCTDELCNPDEGCIYTAHLCDDGDACRDDFCEPESGCLAIPVNCDDENPCTIDYCADGACVNEPVICDDNNVCTRDFCLERLCNFILISCDNGDACTDDFCDSITFCYYLPHNCDDSGFCTDDFCDSQSGCYHSEHICNDDNPCTIDECIEGDCSYTNVNLGVKITLKKYPEWCQGAKVKLNALASNPAVRYWWSTAETTPAIDAHPGTINYSITVTDGNGCAANATIAIADDFWNQLFASYIIIAEKEIHLHRNMVYSGGLGVTRSNGKIHLHNGTMVTAPGTFAEADEIHLNGASALTVQINSPANVSLPPFEYNPNCSDRQNVNIPKNSVVTLTGSVYGDLTIDKGSTVTFTQPNLYMKNLHVKDYCTVKFADCTRLHICKKLHLDKNNAFNPDEKDVIVYVEDGVEIGKISKVVADIYVLRGKLSVEKGELNNPSIMKGYFIANYVHAEGFTNWYQNTNCNYNCSQLHLAAKLSSEEDKGNEPGNLNVPSAAENIVLLKAYPNPFSEKLNIEFTLPENSKVKLEIFNISGQRLATVFEGWVSANQHNKTEYAPDASSGGIIIYRLLTEKGTWYDKAVMAR